MARGALIRRGLDVLTAPAVSSTLNSGLLRIVGLVATFALGVLLARILGPAGFGIYGIVTTTVTLFATVSVVGTPYLAVREVAVAREREAWPTLKGILVWFSLAVGAWTVTLTAVLFAFSVVFRGEFSRGFAAAVPWAMILIPLFSMSALISFFLRGLDAVVRSQAMDVIVRPGLAGLLCVGFYLASGGITANAALGLMAVAAAFTLLIGLFWLLLALPPGIVQASAERPRHSWRSVGPLAFIDIFRQLDGTYAVLLMGALASEAEAGVFRVAISLAALLMIPTTVIHIALAPTITRLFERKARDQLQKVLSRAAAGSFAVTTFGTLLVLLIGHPLIILLFGRGYQSAWAPLILLSLAQCIYAFFGLGPILLAMARAERPLATIYFTSVSISIAAALPCIFRFGAAGGAAAAIAGATINGILVRRASLRFYALDVTPFATARQVLMVLRQGRQT